ncbi:MAG: hypothetical protein R8K21_01325 [Mariprofundales bacterium]
MPDFVSDKVEELEILFNDDIRNYEVEFIDGLVGYREFAKFLGVVVLTGHGRDSGAKVGNGISLVDGEMGSGGSQKNWTVRLSNNSKIRLKLPKNLVELYSAEIAQDNVKISEIS